MQIEIYDKFEKPFTFEPAQEAEFEQLETDLTLEVLRAQIGLCSTLGLRAQAKTLQEYHILYTLKKSIPHPWLSKEEEQAVRAIFPTAYKDKLTPQEEWRAVRKLEDYAFDLIPWAVLESWNAATRYLSRFEIWTAEKLREPDPVLVAHHADHPYVYVIARWGDALRPWAELLEKSQAFHPFRSQRTITFFPREK